MWATFARLFRRRLLAALAAILFFSFPLLSPPSWTSWPFSSTNLQSGTPGALETSEERQQAGNAEAGGNGPISARPQLPRTSGSCVAAEANVDQEWCGVNGNDCFTDLENQYLLEHWAEMRPALEIVRSPGCFPHGLSVATLGYYRSGSTLLYNLLRAWMALGALGNLVAGYRCSDPLDPDMGLQPGGGSYGCSYLCKDHEVRSAVSENVQVVFMSHRHPFDSVCSRKLMGVWCQLDQSGRAESADWPELEAYRQSCEATPTLERREALRQCQMLMKMQADVYRAREVLNKSIAYDLSVSAFHEKPYAEASNIGKALGLCQAAYEAPALLEFLVAMARDLHEKPAAHIEITLMHDVHTTKQRLEHCANLRGWMREEEQCKAWMDGSGHPDSNGLLKKLRQAGAT